MKFVEIIYPVDEGFFPYVLNGKKAQELSGKKLLEGRIWAQDINIFSNYVIELAKHEKFEIIGIVCYHSLLLFKKK